MQHNISGFNNCCVAKFFFKMPLYMDILNFLFTTKTSAGLKIIVMFHFVLTTLGASGSFSPITYLFYNVIIILLLLWSIYEKNSVEPLRLVMAFELCAFIIDVFNFVSQVNELSNTHRDLLTFNGPLAAVAIILQMTSRPFVAVYLVKRKEVQENLSIAGDYEPAEYETKKRNSIVNNPFENNYSEITTRDLEKR